jgi:mono/diheme cytochrome c family protein
MQTHRALFLGLLVAGCMTGTAADPPRHPFAAPSLADTLDWEAAARGRAIALVGCASCHAVDATGSSPLADAPPFREILRRRSLDDIEAGMAQGLVTSHPSMPPYVFRAAEIDDLRAYLETLKVDRLAMDLG